MDADRPERSTHEAMTNSANDVAMADDTPTLRPVQPVEGEDGDQSASFSVSLFSPGGPNGEPRQDTSSGFFSSGTDVRAPRIARTETEQMMPPGAFFATPAPETQPGIHDLGSIVEEDANTDVDLNESISSRRGPSARSRASTKSKAKTRREAIGDGEENLNRSIPGSLIGDELDGSTDEGEETQDNVAPLPRATRSIRKGRGGTSASISAASDDGHEDDGASGVRRTTRRSSRLGSANDEQSSPERMRRSTRSTAVKTEGRTRTSKKRS
jgi:hypothetical protein